MASKPIEIVIIAKDGATKTIKGVASAVDELGNAGSSVEKTATAIDGIGESSSRSASKVDQFVGTLEKVASVTAAIEVGQKALDWVEEGNKVNSIASSYQKLAEAENVQADLLLGKMRTASKGYVDDVTLMAGANKALLQGGDELANQLPKLLQIAGASAKATGGDMKQLYSDLVEGIVKAEPEILDNLGLTINLTQTYDAFAASLNKSANDLTQAEKSQALLNEVLRQGDGFIAKVGDSSIEAGSSLQKLKTDLVNVKNELQGLASIGLEQVLSGGGYERKQTDLLLAEIKTYEEYSRVLEKTEASSSNLSREEWNLSQAMIAAGTGVTEANASAKDLTRTTTDLIDRIKQMEDGSGTATAGAAAMEQQIHALASAYPEHTDRIIETINAQVEQGTSVENLIAVLAELGPIIELTSDADSRAEATALNSAIANYEQAASVFELTDAEYANAESKLNMALEAERATQFEQDLNRAYAMSGDGAFGASAATIYLMNAYKLEASEVSRLIALHNELIKARGGTAGNAAAGALAKTFDYMDDPPSLTPAYEKPKKGRSSSKRSGGKSEVEREREREEKELAKIEERIAKTEEKFNKQAERIEQDHAKRRAAIWDDFYKKQLAALEKFNQDKFGNQLSFFDSLKGMEDAARTRAIVAETQAWEKSQQLAATKGPQVADEWYKMRIEQIKADEDRAASIADLEQKVTDEMDAAQKARLQNELNYQKELDRRHDLKDQEDLKRLEDGGDELAKERDQQLAEEDQRFKESQDDLLANYKETLEEVAGKTDEFTSRIVSAIDTMIAGFDRMASAAGSAATGGGGGVDGSHAGGLFRVPYDGYIAKLHQGERVLTRAEAKEYDRIASRPMPRGGDMRIASSAPMAGSRSQTIIDRRTNIVHATFGAGAPRAEVAAAKGDLHSILDQHNERSARDDQRKRFMGG